MNIKSKSKSIYSLLLLLILLTPASFATLLTNLTDVKEGLNSTTNDNISKGDDYSSNLFYPKASDIIHKNEKIDLALWWNKSFRYRIGFILEEKENIDRNQPIDIYFTFRENEHYENTERIISFNATGNDEWSDPIPMQMWNVTKYSDTDFIKSCAITFIADVPASTNKTYFLYYNENSDGINQIDYNTGFSSQFDGKTLIVTVGSEYEVELEEGLSVTKLERLGYNFHLNKSLSPEKQLTDPSLKFLAHFENSTSDSTGNTADGIENGDPEYVDGRVQYGIEFDGNDFVSYANALENNGDPLDGASTEFTICGWINPSLLSGGATNHQTENVIAAKASDPINDNFEIGVNNEGNIHVYLDTESRDTYADFGPAGTITTTGGWYFIAFRYDQGTAQVCIQDTNVWYSSNAWSGANDLDEADGSPFTIGASEHINQYFKGVIDEVAVYNKYLSNQEIEDYKFGSMPSAIQTITPIENGEIFSRYSIDWTTTFDMHILDICTFYYDYKLWSVNRSIYFDNQFNSTIDRMFVLNTYFDLTGLNDHDDFLYFYDGTWKKDIRTTEFIAENYTIIHNAPDPSKDALGIFIEGYDLSDPAHMNITYLKGDVIYNEGVVEYVPGSINDLNNNVGGEESTLYVYFWEFIDGVNESGTLDEAGMAQYFDDTLETLRNPVTIYLYEQDSFFYTLKVNITDIDDKLVPEATITVWNASNPTINWAQQTDEFGETTFDRLTNGTYIVNASYTRYGETLTITTPKIIELNETEVDPYGVYKLSFENVTLTSLNLTFHRVDSGIFQEYVVGANITFTIDDGSGPKLLGSEYTDTSGNVIFHWRNITTDGNVSFTVTWHGTQYINLGCEEDLDKLDHTQITLLFNQSLETIVNVTTGDTFKSFLYVNSTGLDNLIFGDTLSVWVNYTYTKNGLPIYGLPIEYGTVRYDIKIGTTKINTATLYFNEVGNGVYSLQADSSSPIEPGGANWISGITYTIVIYASKPGYIANTTSPTFNLLDRPTNLIANVSQAQVYWNDILTLDVQYTDIYAEPDEDINDAEVDYYAISIGGITGNLIPYGSGGLYKLELNSSVFPSVEDYLLEISASKQNYEAKSIIIPLKIFEINTRLNGSVAIYDTYDVFVGTSKVLYFEYTVEATGNGLSDIDIKKCEWEKKIGKFIVDSGVIELNDLGNGMFKLDLNTELLEIANYTLIVSFSEMNYVRRDAIIFLNIIPREFEIEMADIVSVVSGNSLSFDISLIDPIDTTPIINAEVYLMLSGNRYNFTDEDGDGTYTVIVPESVLPDAFFSNELLTASIHIAKANYSDTTESIYIDVKMTEVFPGFPMFYFLMIIIGVVAIVAALVAYRTIQRARIPTFVKKAREMKNNIKGNKSISESLLYPSKEEYIVKRVGDKWEMLGLSLADILGVEGKRVKRMSEPSELEGGGI